MKTYPLESITLSEAIEKQFQLVDAITKEFSGLEVLALGDLGVVSPYNQPTTTIKVEKALARFFQVEACRLVRGAGSGAIKEGLMSLLNPGSTLLVHQAPIYETTKTTLKWMNINLIEVDFNDLNALKETLKNNKIDAVLIQYTRQTLTDSYEMGEVIKTIKENSDLPIITDDNYAVMKVTKIGVELGADLSAFSTFKLLGPEGIGCLVGKQKYIDPVVKRLYSGGSQVQGHEALETLRGMIYAPVALAIQAQVVDEVAQALNQGRISGVLEALVANAQSKVVIVKLKKNNAAAVIKKAAKLGAAPHPIGAESKYEFVPMFYRVSKTVADQLAGATDNLIRINPMRSGTETVLRILEEAIALEE